MKFIKRFILTFNITLMLIFFCACSSQTTQIDNETIVNGSLGPQEELENNSNSSSVLNVGILKNTGPLHPLYVANEQTQDILSLIFEPAIKLNSIDTPSASVIESWDVSEDGLNYTFHVRQNVYFHENESTVSANDIISALKTIMNADASVCKYSRYKGCVSSYSASDDYTINVTLNSPSRDIFYLMSFPVYPASVYSGLTENTYKTPVGTGGYRVASYDQETGFVLEKNDKWWRVSGNISSVNVKFYEDNAEIISAYRNGEINCVINTDFSSAVYTSSTNSTVYYTTTQYYDALVPNCRKYPLNSAEMRKGLSLALQRADIIKQALQGEGVSTMTPLRTDKWYLNEVDRASDSDKTAALEAFSKAGYSLDSNGTLNSGGIALSLNIVYCDNSDTGYKANVAQIIKSQLETVGITVNLTKLSNENMTAVLANGNYDLALCSFYSGANDDVSMFFGTDSSLNYGGYYGESLQGLNNAAKNSVGDGAVKTGYSALYDYLFENSPHIGLYFRTHSFVLPSGLPNVGLIRTGQVFNDINTWKNS